MVEKVACGSYRPKQHLCFPCGRIGCGIPFLLSHKESSSVQGSLCACLANPKITTRHLANQNDSLQNYRQPIEGRTCGGCIQPLAPKRGPRHTLPSKQIETCSLNWPEMLFPLKALLVEKIRFIRTRPSIGPLQPIRTSTSNACLNLWPFCI